MNSAAAPMNHITNKQPLWERRNQPGMLIEHYKMYSFAATKYSSAIRNPLSWLKPLVVKGLKECKYLPKALIIVLEDDLMRHVNLTLSEAEEGEYELILKYLMEEIHIEIINYKDNLPMKSKTDFFKHFIWIVPPQHKYFKNNRFRGTSVEC